MQTILLGSSGPTVTAWQEFLRGQDLYFDEAHGTFDAATDTATKSFQRAHGLGIDGEVGPKTWGKAESLGFKDDDLDDADGPDRPTDLAPASLALRQKLFGAFQFTPAPSPGNPEGIKILGTWTKDNIVTVTVPQLVGVTGAHPRGLVSFHKKATPQLLALFAGWEAAGLMHHVLTYAGTWNPRFVRGSRTSLSNHAWGTAIDLNAQWNGLKMRPALKGAKGSVRELVPLAVRLGFWWGGWFERQDGMHFECAKLLTAEEIEAATAVV